MIGIYNNFILCSYVRMYVSVCVCVRTCACVCARACVCVCVCVCARARARAHACMYTRGARMQVYPFVLPANLTKLMIK